ncbi:hypothetical protein C8Z91_22210 [Paenibacillus elgii]|uniref:DNA methylase adenine-specific domain-containing protein n=1 Tax=Paenibacillus elgii TaxID=189691 RepID=A0A2T6FYW9_9BACL|nr:N-6 DNA methylase [Paenibacillus elgii]PUA37061.1 hypothetical protein C8Z91_22210 [Paenibacillus elgii]
MVNKRNRLYKIQKRIEELGALLNKETVFSLLLIRLVSKTYCSPLHQFLLEDYLQDNCSTSTISETPWDIVVNKQGGSYSVAIERALASLDSHLFFIQELQDEDMCREVNETALCEFIRMISDLAPLDGASLTMIFENVLKREAGSNPTGYGDVCIPSSLVQCLVSLLAPDGGSIYDPCCGSGAFLLGAAKMIPKEKSLMLYGQTLDLQSRKTCQMNLMLHGLEVNLGVKCSNTLIYDQHLSEKFDYILANPPFNLSNWCKYDILCRDNQWRYGIPPYSNANFAWLQHTLFYLNEHGRAVLLLPNGTLTSRNYHESRIREAIIRDGVVEAIITFPAGLFNGTKIPFCAWVLNRERHRPKSMLIIDAEQLEPKIRRTLTEGHIDQLLKLFAKHRNGDLQGRSSSYAVVTQEDIAGKEYILSPNLYTYGRRARSVAAQKDTSRLAACIDVLQATLTDENVLSRLEQWRQGTMDSSWEKTPLLDLYDVFGGISKGKEAFGQGHPMLDLKTIIRHPFVPDSLAASVQVSEEELSKYGIQYGDIFLNRTSESLDQLARCSVAVKDYKAVYTGFAKRLRPKGGRVIYPPYAAGYFQSAVYRKDIMDVSTVFTTRASMDNRKLSRLSVCYPTWDLQCKIGDTLLAIFQNLCFNEDPKQHLLLKTFQELLIEQTITFPIVCFFDMEDR